MSEPTTCEEHKFMGLMCGDCGSVVPINKFVDAYDKLSEENERLKAENERIESQCNNWYEKACQDYEENERLKKKVEKMKQIIHDEQPVCGDCVEAKADGYTICGDCSCRDL